jgi:hypothetical protein
MSTRFPKAAFMAAVMFLAVSLMGVGLVPALVTASVPLVAGLAAVLITPTYAATLLVFGFSAAMFALPAENAEAVWGAIHTSLSMHHQCLSVAAASAS